MSFSTNDFTIEPGPYWTRIPPPPKCEHPLDQRVIDHRDGLVKCVRCGEAWAAHEAPVKSACNHLRAVRETVRGAPWRCSDCGEEFSP